MAREARTIFLARRSYRRRRVMDLGRLLPVAGTILFMLPVFWAGAIGTASGLLYIFGAWFVLICAALLLSGPIRRAEADPEVGMARKDEGSEEF